MPSAANVNVKVDKQIANPPPDSALALGESSANLTPLRQAITTIEHKIRNLEKRKSKLESYKELQNAGRELNSDQKTAVAKYDEVIQTLDFARDLCKQFIGIAACSEKDAKKQAKREAAVKSQAELARLREILLVQDALNQMGNEAVRDDFLHGKNGAAQLSEVDLKLLDDLYPAVTPKHESGNPTSFTSEVQTAAEHLLAVVDGKPKEVFGGSYSQIKEVLGKIHESGYFDQAQDYTETVEAEEEPIAIELASNHEPEPEIEPVYDQSEPPIVAHQIEPLPIMDPILPVVPQQLNVVEQQLPPEPMYYQHQPTLQAPPPLPSLPPPVRPITEVLGTGSFFFLQDSEIDTPPEQITTQTFTNQTFVSTAPPPPIPLPIHFQQQQQQQPLPPQQNVVPVSANLPQLAASQAGNNGIDDAIVHKKQATNDESHKQLGGGPGTTGNRPPAHRNNNQAYYQPQNNNNYNNRPRQNRNGPRPTNNNTRHN